MARFEAHISLKALMQPEQSVSRQQLGHRGVAQKARPVWAAAGTVATESRHRARVTIRRVVIRGAAKVAPAETLTEP